MKRARKMAGRAFTLTLGAAKPRAAGLNAALRGKRAGAHGKLAKALRRAARVALAKGEGES